MRIYLSPPFGNLMTKLTIPMPIRMVPIIGTYSLNPKGSVSKAMLKSVRYDWENKGWLSNLKLNNPGIYYGLKEYENNPESVISIAFENQYEMFLMNKVIPNDTPIEINLPLSNIDINDEYNLTLLSDFINPERVTTILKISHLTSLKHLNILFDVGFRNFHCSYPILTDKGDLSGKNLML